MPYLLGMDVTEQGEIDKKLVTQDGAIKDGFRTKESIGANTALATSLAVMHAAAGNQGMCGPAYVALLAQLIRENADSEDGTRLERLPALVSS
jgi:enolase